MSEKIVVPALGESITEATVAKWLKNKGDKVKADEPVVELETDKVNLEVPSPLTGVIEEINAKNGEIVEVGALLGSISSNVSSTKVNLEKNEVSKSVSENNIVNLNNERKKDVPKIFDEEKNDLKEKPLVLINEIHEKKPLILKDRNESLSPAVRKIVSENNIDIKKGPSFEEPVL